MEIKQGVMFEPRPVYCAICKGEVDRKYGDRETASMAVKRHVYQRHNQYAKRLARWLHTADGKINSYTGVVIP